METFRPEKVFNFVPYLWEEYSMERRYILNAIDAALQAGEKILSIYDDPASDFQVEKIIHLGGSHGQFNSLS